MSAEEPEYPGNWVIDCMIFIIKANGCKLAQSNHWMNDDYHHPFCWFIYYLVNIYLVHRTRQRAAGARQGSGACWGQDFPKVAALTPISPPLASCYLGIRKYTAEGTSRACWSARALPPRQQGQASVTAEAFFQVMLMFEPKKRPLLWILKIFF